jgi:seryl-tRNA(Sec) selenium transferase
LETSGPQVPGVLSGRKDLIDAALYNTNPWEGFICRSMKVDKEEIMGVSLREFSGRHK